MSDEHYGEGFAALHMRNHFLEVENERLTRWRRHIMVAPSDESREEAVDLFRDGERLAPIIASWKEVVANMEQEKKEIQDTFASLRYWLKKPDDKRFACKQALDIVNSQMHAWGFDELETTED